MMNVITELVFVVCLSTEPAVCESKVLQFSDTSVMVCVMSAQPVLAQWTSEHPGWTVQRWTCRPKGSERNA